MGTMERETEVLPEMRLTLSIFMFLIKSEMEGPVG